jgi:hypothetical protein
MSKDQYQEGCRGCQPVLIDLVTGKAMPDDSPLMVAIFSVWNTLSRQEKEAWHEFTCSNSREPQILAVVERINQRFTEAAEKQRLTW